MPDSPEILARQLGELVQPGVRGRLVARGMARGLIWKDGELSEGSPDFSMSLTDDLLDHGYALLSHALLLRGAPGHDVLVVDALRIAAESLEAAVRKGDPHSDGRLFHLVMAGAAFHLAGYSARAFCLVPSFEMLAGAPVGLYALTALMRRNFVDLERVTSSWLLADQSGDDAMVERIENDPTFSCDDLIGFALDRNLLRSLALFLASLESGDTALKAQSGQLLRDGYQAAADARIVQSWWLYVMSLHLTDELWARSLHVLLPAEVPGEARERWMDLRSRFISLLAARAPAEVDLWPSQVEAAARSIDPFDDLVVALPTSAGKTRIAELCILRALADGKRIVYVTPLRALSAQLERGLGNTFRPLGYSVSSLYGASGVAFADIGTLRASQIVVSTPEKLDFAVRQEPSVIDDVGLVVFDEGHMIGLGTREVRYEVLIQSLLARPDAAERRICCLSAVFSAGDAFDGFTEWLRWDVPGKAIESTWRPTRQRQGLLLWNDGRGALTWDVDGESPFLSAFVAAEPATGRRTTAFPHTSQEFSAAAIKALHRDGHRVLVYCPMRRSVEPFAEALLKLHRQGYVDSFVGPDAERAIERAVRVGQEWLGGEHVALRALRIGVAIHHGALPRPYLTEIEALLRTRVVPIAVASPTLAQGLDLSCSALVFHSIYRGKDPIAPEEYANVVGRAGRAYVDVDGLALYPIFDAGPKRWAKRRSYEKLIEDAKSRRLESGIVMLVSLIATTLGSRLPGGRAALLEYVANSATHWGDDLPSVEPPLDTAEADRQQRRLELALSDLDAALLGTIPDLDAPADELGRILDEAMALSLWRRRMERRSSETLTLQRAVLLGRARWIWARTDVQRRRAFFASGIGLRTGEHLFARQEVLVAQLRDAEVSLDASDLERCASLVCSIASTLFEVHPFAPEQVPARWMELIHSWLAGRALSEALSDDAESEVEFVQDGLVYRLVWGLEAVRVHGLAADNEAASDISGSLALCITYGAASAQAALLLQAGLSSRRIAHDAIHAFRPSFRDQDGMVRWLRDLAIQADAVWLSDADDRAVWSDFLSRWGPNARDTAIPADQRVRVLWDTPAEPPAAGTYVRIIAATGGDGAEVLSVTMERLGTVAEPWSPQGSRRPPLGIVESSRSSIRLHAGLLATL